MPHKTNCKGNLLITVLDNSIMYSRANSRSCHCITVRSTNQNLPKRLVISITTNLAIFQENNHPTTTSRSILKTFKKGKNQYTIIREIKVINLLISSLNKCITRTDTSRTTMARIWAHKFHSRPWLFKGQAMSPWAYTKSLTCLVEFMITPMQTSTTLIRIIACTKNCLFHSAVHSKILYINLMTVSRWVTLKNRFWTHLDSSQVIYQNPRDQSMQAIRIRKI